LFSTYGKEIKVGFIISSQENKINDWKKLKEEGKSFPEIAKLYNTPYKEIYDTLSNTEKRKDFNTMSEDKLTQIITRLDNFETKFKDIEYRLTELENPKQSRFKELMEERERENWTGY
jgi:hypothetical protein